MNVLLCVPLAAFLLAGACTKATQPTTDEGAGQSVDMLSLVPADSPFVFAGVKPMPKELVDWAANGLAPLSDMAQGALAEAKADASEPMERALLEELDGKLSRKGLTSLGLSLRPRFAIYAIGWSVALRFELASGKKLESVIARVEKKGGEAAPKATLKGITYRYLVEDDIALVFAIIKNEAVFGVMHEKARDKVLPVLFGLKKPKSNAKKLFRSAQSQYKLQGFGSGYFDTRALLDLVTGRGSALSKDILAVSEVDIPALSPTCRKEFTELAGVMPRWLFGYEKLAGGRAETLMAIELREDIAKEVSALFTPLLNFKAMLKDEPLMAIGVGIDLNKSLVWARQKAMDVAKKPYQCEHLVELNEAAGEVEKELEQPLPPFINGFKALALMAEELEVGGLIPSGKGYGVMGISNPMALIEMAKAEVPDLAGLDVKPGKPVALPLGLPGLPTLDLLVRDQWLGLAAGAGMTDKLNALLNAKPDPKGPAMVIGYNYKEFMQKLTALNTAGPEEALILDIMGKMFGFTGMEASFTGQGVMIRQSMAIK